MAPDNLALQENAEFIARGYLMEKRVLGGERFYTQTWIKTGTINCNSWQKKCARRVLLRSNCVLTLEAAYARSWDMVWDTRNVRKAGLKSE